MGVAAARRARERKRDEVAVLAAADPVFARTGFEEATVREIARAASCSQAKVLELFSSKERLFAAVLMAHVEVLDESLRRVSLHAVTARERLGAIVLERVRRSAYRPAFTRLLESPYGEGVAPEVQRAYGRLQGRIRGVVMEGVRSGELRREPRAEVLAQMLDAAVRVYTLDAVKKTDPEPDEAEVEAVVSALLDGVIVTNKRARRKTLSQQPRFSTERA